MTRLREGASPGQAGLDEEEDEADGSSLVRLNWAGRRRAFRLGLGEIRRLQKLTGFGVEILLRRLATGEWFIDEPAAILLLGLEGAGTDDSEARSLVTRYFHGRPANASIPVCSRILSAVLLGPKHDEIAPVARDGDEDDAIDPAGRLKFSDIYGAGAAMGMTPGQVDAMSIWEFRSSLEGWKRAHAAEPDEAPGISEERYRELMGSRDGLAQC